MHKLRATVALAAAVALVGCQTVDGVRVNGVQLTSDARAQAQPGGSGWMWALGIAGAIGVGLLAAGGGGGSSGGFTGGTSGGGSVGGSGGGAGGTGPCQGCWDY